MTCCDSPVARLRHRVTIQSLSTSSDGQGGQVELWVDGKTVYAEVIPAKAYEKFQAMQMQTPISHRITMRYRTDITSQSRLKFDGKILWVVEVINQDHSNRFLIIKAIERA